MHLAYAIAVEGREDRAAVFRHPAGTMVVIADGAGGTGGGAAAATAVIARLTDAGWPADGVACAALLSSMDGEIGPGESTALVVCISERGIHGASVGDSEARWFTRDALVDLTDRQRRKPLLGSGRARPVAFDAPSSPGVLVAGSDGLWKYVPARRIGEWVLAPPAEAARRLLDAARLENGKLQDDFSVVVCAITPGDPSTG